MYIRKKDLIKLLKPLNDNAIIVLQKDSEGNEDKKPLSKIKKCVYLPRADVKYAGETFIAKLTPKLKKDGYTEEDLCPDKARGISAILLIPSK